MSLINNYLKKTRLQSEGGRLASDVPPLLKAVSAKNDRRHWQLAGLVAFCILLAGGTLAYRYASAPAPQVVAEKAQLTPVQAQIAPGGDQSVARTPLPAPPAETPPPAQQIVSQTAVAGPEGVLHVAEQMEQTRPPSKQIKPQTLRPPGYTPGASDSRQTTTNAYDSVQADSRASQPDTPIPSRRETASAPPATKKSLPLRKSPTADAATEPMPPPKSSAVAQMPNTQGSERTELLIDASLQAARVARREGHYRQAETLYTDVLKHEPEHPEALTGLGDVYTQLGDEARAVAIIDKILARDPGNTEARLNLGLLMLNRHDFSNAEKQFLLVLTDRPRDRTALTSLAVLAQHNGDFAALETWYQQLLTLNPQDLNTLLVYAGAMEQKRDFNKAMELYIRALAAAENVGDAAMVSQVRERLAIITQYMQSSPNQG